MRLIDYWILQQEVSYEIAPGSPARKSAAKAYIKVRVGRALNQEDKMSIFIATEVTGDTDLYKLIEELPDEVGDAVVDDISTYLVNSFKIYPPFKHVTRKEAYPETGDGFFSDKQRKWFFANLREGNIPEPSARNRTNKFSKEWKQVGKGLDSFIANETSYGPYLMGNDERARLSQLAGWATMNEEIESRYNRIKRIIEGTAKRVLKRMSKGSK